MREDSRTEDHFVYITYLLYTNACISEDFTTVHRCTHVKFACEVISLHFQTFCLEVHTSVIHISIIGLHLMEHPILTNTQRYDDIY